MSQQLISIPDLVKAEARLLIVVLLTPGIGVPCARPLVVIPLFALILPVMSETSNRFGIEMELAGWAQEHAA